MRPQATFFKSSQTPTTEKLAALPPCPGCPELTKQNNELAELASKKVLVYPLVKAPGGVCGRAER
jgi:hypothetical protein